MAQTKVELNLDFEEYRAATDALTGVAYERVKLASTGVGDSAEHLRIAEAIAKVRHEIDVQIGLDGEGLDPVSEAVAKGWEAYHSPIRKVELQLTSDEYKAMVVGLGELARGLIQEPGRSRNHISEALVKARDQIISRLGISQPARDSLQALDELVDSWYKRFDLEEMREGAKFVEETFAASTTTHDLKSEITGIIRQDLGNDVDPELADQTASKILQLIGKGWTDFDCMQQLDGALESNGQRPRFQDVSVGTRILFDYGFYRKTSETEARMIDCVHPETFLGDAFTVDPEKRVFLSLAMRSHISSPVIPMADFTPKIS